jgi:hypothetical protein
MAYTSSPLLFYLLINTLYIKEVLLNLLIKGIIY